MPYIHGDVGFSNSFVTLDFGDFGEIKDFQLTPIMQAGAGFDVKLGPITLGAIYKYLFLSGNNFEYELSHEGVDVDGELKLDGAGGHGFEIKIGTNKSIF